jgi:hypothetical protein
VPTRQWLDGKALDAEGDMRLLDPRHQGHPVPPPGEGGGQVAERRLGTTEWAAQGGCNVVVPTEGIQENDLGS